MNRRGKNIVTISSKGFIAFNKNIKKLRKNILVEVDLSAKRLARRYVEIAQDILFDKQRFGTPERRVSSSIFFQKSPSSKKSVSYVVKTNRPDAALPAEFGSKPHPITFRLGGHGDMLARGWRGNVPTFSGNTVTHQHPGSRGLFFMQGAFDKITKEADIELNKLFNKSAPSFFK